MRDVREGRQPSQATGVRWGRAAITSERRMRGKGSHASQVKDVREGRAPITSEGFTVWRAAITSEEW